MPQNRLLGSILIDSLSIRPIRYDLGVAHLGLYSVVAMLSQCAISLQTEVIYPIDGISCTLIHHANGYLWRPFLLLGLEETSNSQRNAQGGK
jgi:hypothetical protein